MLCDVMGLGKTRVAINIMDHYGWHNKSPNAGAILLLVPSSTIETVWLKEWSERQPSQDG